jgi:hypothetical protein
MYYMYRILFVVASVSLGFPAVYLQKLPAAAAVFFFHLAAWCCG